MGIYYYYLYDYSFYFKTNNVELVLKLNKYHSSSILIKVNIFIGIEHLLFFSLNNSCINFLISI